MGGCHARAIIFFCQVVQYAVDNQALLVTNDNYNNLSFESKAFKEQIENRLVGFSWDWGEFSLSTERKTEAWYPNLNSINWRRGPDSLVTDRQQQIAGTVLIDTRGVSSMMLFDAYTSYTQIIFFSLYRPLNTCARSYHNDYVAYNSV